VVDESLIAHVESLWPHLMVWTRQQRFDATTVGQVLEGPPIDVLHWHRIMVELVVESNTGAMGDFRLNLQTAIDAHVYPKWDATEPADINVPASSGASALDQVAHSARRSWKPYADLLGARCARGIEWELRLPGHLLEGSVADPRHHASAKSQSRRVGSSRMAGAAHSPAVQSDYSHPSSPHYSRLLLLQARLPRASRLSSSLLAAAHG
jgi:hypothetical protein